MKLDYQNILIDSDEIVNQKLLSIITELTFDDFSTPNKNIFIQYEFPVLKTLNLNNKILNYLPHTVENLTINSFLVHHQFDEIVNLKSLTIENQFISPEKLSITINFNYTTIEHLSYDARQFYLLDFTLMPCLKTLDLIECDEPLQSSSVTKYSGYTGIGELPQNITTLSYIVRNFAHLPVKLEHLTLSFFENNNGIIMCDCETLIINCYTNMNDIKLKITGVKNLTVRTSNYCDNANFINNLISQYDLLVLQLSNRYYRDTQHLNSGITYSCNIIIPPNLIELFYEDTNFVSQRIIKCNNLTKCNIICSTSKIVLNTPALLDLRIDFYPSFLKSYEEIYASVEVVYETNNILNKFTAMTAGYFEIDFSQIKTQHVHTIHRGMLRENKITLPKCHKYEIDASFDECWVHDGIDVLIVNDVTGIVNIPSLKKLIVKNRSLIDKIIVPSECEVIVDDE